MGFFLSMACWFSCSIGFWRVRVSGMGSAKSLITGSWHEDPKMYPDKPRLGFRVRQSHGLWFRVGVKGKSPKPKDPKMSPKPYDVNARPQSPKPGSPQFWISAICVFGSAVLVSALGRGLSWV